MRGKRENFFSREKKFSLSPRAPLSLSRKAEKLFYLPSPARAGNRAVILFFELYASRDVFRIAGNFLLHGTFVGLI